MTKLRFAILSATLLTLLVGCKQDGATDPTAPAGDSGAMAHPQGGTPSTDGPAPGSTPTAGSVTGTAATEVKLDDVTPPAVAEPIHVDAAAGAELLAADPEIVPLDVRTQPEIDAGHLENAVFCDFKADDFAAKLGELDRSKAYLVYCAVGGRSKMALSTLKELGFTRVYHLDGGMTAWRNAGNKVVQ